MIIIDEWHTLDTHAITAAWLDTPAGRTLHAAYQPSGPSPVCPVCSPLNGLRFERGRGPVPPLHPHCRCTRTPVATYDPASMSPQELIRLGRELDTSHAKARAALPPTLAREIYP